METRGAPNDETMDAIRVRYEVLNRIIKNVQYDGKAIQAEAWEAFQEIRHLRRAVATMVNEINDQTGVVTTQGGDRFAFLTDTTEAIRRAVLSVAPEEPRKVTVRFEGGPWDGQAAEVERVIGPLFSPGHEVGNHYWLDTKSDPPTYHWNPDA